MQEAALVWCHGLHNDWERKIWEIPASEGKEVIPHPREERRKRKTQSNISRERRTSWAFPGLAESNPLEKRNI